MRLSKLLKWIGFGTLLALVYIHMQMNIIQLAYEGKNKEVSIRHLVEENGYMTYNILTLKSANNLGHKLLAKDSGMDFVSSDNVKMLEASQGELSGEVSSPHQIAGQKSNSLVSFMSFGASAEAKGQ
ncbi:MAG TPA: hypothetical protein VI749_00270 [Candidatus Omnitrophota bacterium]|nr:hypothetical protein [Candidatus Omnitrophota bacterium]